MTVAVIPPLPDTERRTSYTAVATTGPFNVGFDIYGDGTDYGEWVEVWLSGAKLTAISDYVLTSPSGALSTLGRPIRDAQITFTAARSGTVQIVGARRPRRLSQLIENRGQTAHDVNQLTTDMVAELREAWDQRNRTLMVPPGETLAALPPAAQRALKYVTFDSFGALLLSSTAPVASTPASNLLYLDIRDYGAKVDGATDDTAAWNAAINAANLLGNCSIVHSRGVSVVTAKLNAITADHVYVTAAGAGAAARIEAPLGVALFTWGDTGAAQTVGGGFLGGAIQCTGATTVGQICFDLRNVTRWICDHPEFVNVGYGVVAGVVGVATSSVIFVNCATGYGANVGVPFLDVRQCNGFFVRSGSYYVTGVNPAANPSTVAVDRNWLNVNSGACDTVVCYGYPLVEDFYYGANIVAVGAVTVNDIWLECIFDGCAKGVRGYVTSGALVTMQLFKCWVTAMDGIGIEINSGGTLIDLCRIESCHVFNTGTHGISIGAYASRTHVINNKVFGNDRSASGTASCILLAGGSTGVKVSGNLVGFDATALGLPARAAYGITVGGDCDYLLVTQNHAEGATSGFNLSANTTGNTRRLIRDNLGANYAGIQSGGTWAIPASTVAWTNKTSHFVHAMVYGGTVTVIAVEGSTTGATAGTFPIRPGGTITVTYTVAPTFKFLVEP